MKCRRLANIIRIWFEGKSPQRKMFSFDVIIKIPFNLWQEVELLILVHFHDGVQYLKVVFDLVRGVYQSMHIFRETTTAIANARKQKSFSNSFVTANSTSDHVHICTHQLAQLRDFVHK